MFYKGAILSTDMSQANIVPLYNVYYICLARLFNVEAQTWVRNPVHSIANNFDCFVWNDRDPGKNCAQIYRQIIVFRIGKELE